MSREKKEKTPKKVPDDFLIHSPEDEYRSYVEQQIEQLTRVGEQEKIELSREALELGLKTISSVRTKP
jgi:hypothetical protein